MPVRAQEISRRHSRNGIQTGLRPSGDPQRRLSISVPFVGKWPCSSRRDCANRLVYALRSRWADSTNRSVRAATVTESSGPGIDEHSHQQRVLGTAIDPCMVGASLDDDIEGLQVVF